MVNSSQVREGRFWDRWREAGAAVNKSGMPSNGFSLHSWVKMNPVPDQMIWKGSSQYQLKMFGDLRMTALRLDDTSTLRVVSQHRSKSIKLPVVKLTFPKLGIDVWVRHNFSNMAVTVESRQAIKGLNTREMDTRGLNKCYFEGFERGGIPVHGSYDSNKAQFSFHYQGAPDNFAAILEDIVKAATPTS
jgi:hypothetical protein